MKSATTATKTKGAMVKAKPKTIRTLDIDCPLDYHDSVGPIAASLFVCSDCRLGSMTTL